MNPKETDLLDLLEIIILKMMLVEKLETFQIKNHYNIQKIKQEVKRCLQTITPLAERDYPIVFANGEEETQAIIREYESLINLIATLKVPDKVIINQMIEAFNFDKKTMEETTHRILNKTK